MNCDDRVDYLRVLDKFGLTEEEVQYALNRTEDQIPLPDGNYKIKISPSEIQGLGLFAVEDIEESEILGPSYIGYFRTPFDRFVNHSKTPNCKITRIGNNRYILSLRKIRNGEEITVDYITALC
jgi:hypothetical protein